VLFFDFFNKMTLDPLQIPPEILSEILGFLDRPALSQVQLASAMLNALVQRFFFDAPYILYQMLEFRYANRKWALEGLDYNYQDVIEYLRAGFVRCRRTTFHIDTFDGTRFRELIDMIEPLKHVWSCHQLHVRWPPSLLGSPGQEFLFHRPEFSNALHTSHCRPFEDLNVDQLVNCLCDRDMTTDKREASRKKKRIWINSAEWTSTFNQLVETIKTIFSTATVPSIQFELVLQIYPRSLQTTWPLPEASKATFNNETTKELLKVSHWRKGYENVASELSHVCRVRRFRLNP
jgi:hypothetical protein